MNKISQFNWLTKRKREAWLMLFFLTLHGIVSGQAVTVDTTNPSCSVSNGSVNITIAGGSPSYSYEIYDLVANTLHSSLISSASSTHSFTGLSSQNYRLKVYHNNGTLLYNEIIYLRELSFSVTSQTTVTCYNGSDGQVVLKGEGGELFTSPVGYQYRVSSGPWQTSNTFNGMTAGTYLFEITDANSCIKSQNVTVFQNTVISKAITSQIDVTCNGGSNGSFSVVAAGGVSPYEFKLNSGSFQPSNSFSSLTQGSYTVTIKDNVGCETTVNTNITQPTPISAVLNTTNITCFGLTDGKLSLNPVSGSTSPYTYQWTGTGAVSGYSNSNSNITGLAAGTYDYTVTDANGCSKTGQATVQEPSAITISKTRTNVDCNGASTGAVSITPAGGSPVGSPTYISYAWTGPSSYSASTQNISGIKAGEYTITVTDLNNCTGTDTVLISEHAAISLSESVTNVSCNGGSNGAIDLSVSGGVSTYTYSWTPAATTEDLTGLTAGSYSVVVTDAKSCTANKTISVTEPAAIAINSTKVDILCNGASTGSIDVTTTGGTAPLTFSWSGPSSYSNNTEDISSLAAGSYTLTVTDANSCSANATIVLSEPTALSLSTSQVNLLCNGASTGSIDLTISGGVANYTKSWTGPSSYSNSTEDISGLVAGKYDVTVTDANGCTSTGSATLTEPTAISIADAITNVSCNGLLDGAIDLTVSGGTVAGSYTYAWDNSTTLEDLTAVGAGNYAVTVTDDNGCTKTGSYTITEPAALALTNTVTKVLCNGNADGAIDLSVTGGTTPYTFAWTGPNTFSSTSEDITALLAGDYDIVVTDDNNCQISNTITVTEPTAMALGFTRTEVKCKNELNGAIDITVMGGTVAANYVYDWSSIKGYTSSNEDLNKIPADEYTYTITDDNGCVLTDTINVSEPILLTTNIASVSICDGEGTLTFNGLGGTAPYTHQVDKTPATSPVNNLPDKVYEVYTTDANGCNDSVLVNLVHVDPILPTLLTNDITVYLDNAGQVSIKTSDINNGSFDNCGIDTIFLDKYNFDCTNTGANTVTMTVVDINNNSKTKTATVTVLDTISPTITVQNTTILVDTSGFAYLKENMVVVNYNDNCGTDTIVLSKNVFAVSDYGINNVNVTITDLSGNTVVKTVQVTVLIGDTDNDSIPDYIEKNLDTDSDGTMDYADVDSDNDGILDIVENDSNKTFQDFDGDGRPNHLDLDSDNDGINDVIEADVIDANGDGVKDNPAIFISNPANTDLTGNPDYLDLDADDDGLFDAYESKQNYTDANNDGIIDGIDADGDGILEFADGSNVYKDAFDVKPVDSDGDNIGDWRDKDSDGDLIPDAIELSADKDLDGMPNYLDRDSDNDSIPDAVEAGVDPNNPLNTDGGADPNYLDTDSDGDLIPDNLEAGSNPKSPVDTDGDAKPDYIDLDSDEDTIPDAVEAGANANNPADFDSDGVYDFRETDSDKDGIDDKIEAGTDPTNPVNTDGDSEPDYRDLDADDDGISDNTEWSATQKDKDADGKYNYVDTDSDGDELLDKDETTADKDNDSKPDYLDADITIPEGFSPNGDSDNDLLIIKGLKNFPKAELIVFNRNGQVVYESGEGYKNNWDGTNKGINPSLGSTLPEGIYFFVFKPNGLNEQPFTGNIYIKP